MAGRDTKTRVAGVYARHQAHCAIQHGDGCSCRPGYYGAVYDPGRGRAVKTKHLATLDAARNARADLTAALQRGELCAPRGILLREARERFVTAARERRALNKQGRPYKPTAIATIDQCLRAHIEPTLGLQPLADIRRGDVQKIVDELTPRLSGSRIRAIVNSIRSLYRWAQYRDLVEHDPAARIRLPAMNATPVGRVASPPEFARLLDALPLEFALPYALAGYGTGRRAQIIHLRWSEVDLKVGAIEWGVEWEARKYDASRRVVPIVAPLLTLLKRRDGETGHPSDGLVCPPLAEWNTSGRLNPSWVADLAAGRWQDAGLEPITLQQARHSAATWLDAAGVPPKIASVLMGHATPTRQPGAAPITLVRYTHALPEDVEHARHLLDTYLAARQHPHERG